MNFNPLFAFFVLFAFASAFSRGEAASRAAAEELHVNFIVGETGRLTCQSSYPPPWTKLADGKAQIIGVNGLKHASWNQPRYSFAVDEVDDNFGDDDVDNKKKSYSIRISDVRLSDAGEFICGSDEPITVVVSVLR